MAAVGILAALHEARRAGEGQIVDISMTDGSLSWLAMVAGRYFCSGEVPQARRGHALRRDHLLPALRGQGRLGHLRGARAEVLGRLLQRRRPRGPDRAPVRQARVRSPPRGRGDLQDQAPATSGGPSTTSTTADRAGPRPRRGARLRAGPRAGDGRHLRAARIRRDPPARLPGQALADPGEHRPARARARRAHDGGADGGRLLARGDRGLEESGAAEGPTPRRRRRSRQERSSWR